MAKSGRRLLRLEVEQLEERKLLATFVVTSTADAGAGTLRQAILDANFAMGPDQIIFRIPGPKTIAPLSALPALTDPVIIDGTSQPGFSGWPLVTLSGKNAGANANGLLITGGNSTVRGLVIHGFDTGRGIRLEGGGGNRIVGNHIGFDARELLQPCDMLSSCGSVQPHGNRTGVYVINSSNNQIGGTSVADRNVISGNLQTGVFFTGTSTGNSVLGNYIGTTRDGATAHGNLHGIQINGAHGNTIGGTANGARNVISGNTSVGVFVNSGATGNSIAGNYIGTAANGAVAVANGYSGVTMSTGATNNVVGGVTAAERNVISGNAGDGINIFDVTSSGNQILGNYLGTDATGTLDLGNGGRGVGIYDAPANRVGGTAAGSGNVISGNSSDGIAVFGVPAAGNTIEGNLIGTDKNGTAALGNSFQGIVVTDAGNTRIGGTLSAARNIISGNRGTGVVLNTFGAGGATGTVIQGNYIGTNATGTAAVGNIFDGVTIISSPNNAVGGSVAGSGNVISGNGGGIGIVEVASTGNLVQGNYIGTDATGTMGVANGYSGIYIHRASNNTIGGTSMAARNVISGNAVVGISMYDNASSNQVQGNYIGTDATGMVDLGNGYSGVSIDQSSNNNVIGGTTASVRNVISGNDVLGISISNNSSSNQVQGNYIGTNASSTAALGNGGDGVTINSSPNNTVGGSVAGAGNVISGNGSGVGILEVASTGNLVQGNYIGTDATGTMGVANGYSGIYIHRASNNTIGGSAALARNVISGNAVVGISMYDNASSNQVQGNYIGTDATGMVDLGNGYSGVSIDQLSNNNAIGGGTASARNVISGNDVVGVSISANSAGNQVQGNYIGTDVTGMNALGNSYVGVSINSGSSNNRIGGSFAGARNVISANGGGVYIVDIGTTENLVQGNYIGTDQIGISALGNLFHGIYVGPGSSNNTIGGLELGARNIISANQGSGVGIDSAGNLVQGNYIGSDVTGAIDLGNAFSGVFVHVGSNNSVVDNVVLGNQTGIDVSFGVTTTQIQFNTVALNSANGIGVSHDSSGIYIANNSIFGNGELGIDLNFDGVTVNDPLDADAGANGLQNYPDFALFGPTVSGFQILGTMNSTPNTEFTLEFFWSMGCDASGYGEGQHPLTSFTVTTNSQGTIFPLYLWPVSLPYAPGMYITGVAHGPNGTSEFSPCAQYDILGRSTVVASVTGAQLPFPPGIGARDFDHVPLSELKRSMDIMRPVERGAVVVSDICNSILPSASGRIILFLRTADATPTLKSSREMTHSGARAHALDVVWAGWVGDRVSTSVASGTRCLD